MTTPTPTPPCLGEREAVARTWNEIRSRYVIYCNISGNTPAKLWLDKESATEPVFVGPVDDCEARMDLAASDAIIAEHIEPLRTENETLRAERDAAIARAEEAEEEARDARYKADCAEEDECAALSRAEEAESKLTTLTAKLAQAEGEIAAMRAALADLIAVFEVKGATVSVRPDRVLQVALANANIILAEHPHGD